MSAANEITELLETLQSLAGCTFLSDLHAERYRSALLSVLESMEADRYSVQTWNYAASYISMEDCQFTEAALARTWLIRQLASK